MTNYAVISSIGGTNLKYWFSGTKMECENFIQQYKEQVYESTIERLVQQVLVYVKAIMNEDYYQVYWDTCQVDSKFGSFYFDLEDKDEILESLINGEYIADCITGYYPNFKILEQSIET